MCVPVLRWYGAAFYFLCEISGLLNAYLFMAVGIWRPVEHLAQHANKHFENNVARKADMQGQSIQEPARQMR